MNEVLANRLGRMNRRNRVYFKVSCNDMATAIGLRGDELRFVEVGLEPLTEEVEKKCYRYWEEVFRKAHV